MTKQTDIAIIGGGVGGLTLGVLLAQKGLRVDVVDPKAPAPAQEIKPSGRTAALFGGSIDILQDTGVWDEVKPFCGQLKTMRIMDEEIETAFYADEAGREEFGFNIPNDILRAALYERAEKTKGLCLHVPGMLDDYAARESFVDVRLEDGSAIQAKLLIGADGRRSKVREIAGIGVRERPYGQSAMTFVVNHSRAHDGISTEFHRPGGPLAFVPMPGNQCSVVWVEKSARAEELMKLKKQEFEQALQDASQGILGGITLETGPMSWPLCFIKAKALTGERMALAAEAAHVIPPISAQGLNLSLRDVKALVELIAEHAGLGLDIGSATMLARYERMRRGDIMTRTGGVDLLNRMVGNDNRAVQSARRLGLKTVDIVGPVRRLLLQAGLG